MDAYDLFLPVLTHVLRLFFILLQVYVKDLGLNDAARSRLLTLVEKRYHPDTDELVLNSDRCVGSFLCCVCVYVCS